MIDIYVRQRHKRGIRKRIDGDNQMTARTILNQLGGNRFVAMTGAKQLVDLGEGLQFRIGRNCKKVNSVVIKLNGNDLYDVEFYNIRGINFTKKSEAKNVFCDQLADIFEEHTGLYTSL